MKLTSHWPKRHARVVLAAVAGAASLAAGTAIVMHMRGVPPAPPACQLITAQEVQAATGVTVVETGTIDQSHCRYEGSDSKIGKDVRVDISISQKCPDFSSAFYTKVTGIGDQAGYLHDSIPPGVDVSSHGHCFNVRAHVDDASSAADMFGIGDQALSGPLETSLARLAASRI
jgi:hypothetical protein